MGENTGTPILEMLTLAVAASVILSAFVIYLGRSKRVTSRPLLGVLIAIALLPLFGSGLYLAVKHEVWRAEGKTASGANGVHPAGTAGEHAN